SRDRAAVGVMWRLVLIAADPYDSQTDQSHRAVVRPPGTGYMASVDRRNFLLALTGASLSARAAFASSSSLRVAALDWALAETLTTLRCNLVALVAAGDWNRFVVEPELPTGVTDIGLQQQVNYELLAMLNPDLILTSPFSRENEPALQRIAPTERFSVFEPTP